MMFNPRAALVVAEICTLSSVPPLVTEQSMGVSMTIYVSSLIAIAIATWHVAKYDARRVRDNEQIAARMKLIEDRLNAQK